MRHFGGIFGKFPEEIVQKFYGLISSPSVVNTVSPFFFCEFTIANFF